MGRYITGDIETKLWFGVQSSNAADRFGVTGVQPSELYYYFDEENLADLEAELAAIVDKVGLFNLTKIDSFMKSAYAYNDAALEQAGILHLWKMHQHDYADYILGIKIRDCIKATGSCEFTAEL
jgi:hypothetical protein